MKLTGADPFELERFVSAQAASRGSGRLRAGRRPTHWMWFVFPQLRMGLGRSSVANFYGIAFLHEARAHLAHSLLENRLDRSTRIVLDLEDSSLHQRVGSPDDVKFQSSMTLFAFAAADPVSSFHKILDRWCGGFDAQRSRLSDAVTAVADNFGNGVPSNILRLRKYAAQGVANGTRCRRITAGK